MKKNNFIIKKKLITTKGLFISLVLTAIFGISVSFKNIEKLIQNRVIASVQTKITTPEPVVEVAAIVEAKAAIPVVEPAKTSNDEFAILEEKVKAQKILGVESMEREENKRSFKIVLESDVFFKLGTANLERKSRESIQEIINILKPISSISFIEIEGHTDGSPVVHQKVNYPSNWELSAARAASFIPLFANNGFFKDQMKVIGYGDSRPRYSNHMNNEISAKNRRIVLHVFAQEEERKI